MVDILDIWPGITGHAQHRNIATCFRLLQQHTLEYYGKPRNIPNIVQNVHCLNYFFTFMERIRTLLGAIH